METTQQNKPKKSRRPVPVPPRFVEMDSTPSKQSTFGQFERTMVIHNFTNHLLYIRDSRDFVSVVEPESTVRPRHTNIGGHISVTETYTIRGVDAARLNAMLVDQHVLTSTINPNVATAFKNCYDEKIKDAQDRYGSQLDPRRIKNMVVSFSLICTYTLENLRINQVIHCKDAGVVIGLNEEALGHVYPNSEFLIQTKDFTDGKFYRDEVYSSLRLVDNHNEIGDQYIWLLNGVRHIPAVKDSSVESGLYVVAPRACTGEIVHSATRYSFADAQRLFHIRSTQKEAVEAGNPQVSEEVAVKTIEKETKLLSAQGKKEEAEHSTLKNLIQSLLASKGLEDSLNKSKEEKRLSEEKARLESEERERKASYEKRRMEMEEAERQRKAEFEDSERRRRLELEEFERQRKTQAEDLERRIKLEFEQRKVELDRISQLNKMNTEKRLNRNKERSEKTKILGDIMKAAPAIFLGALGLFAIFKTRSA